MKGGHDLGGQEGMGPIDPEPEAQEPVFHTEWERRVFALTLATGMLGRWNIDESRHARERQDPLAYIENSYYENWLEGLETLLLEKGLVDAEELATAKAGEEARLAEWVSVPNPESAGHILASGASSVVESDDEPLFEVGNKVLVRKCSSTGHTRAPRYAQGAVGTVKAYIGCHSYPDSNARGVPEGRPLYSVVFDSEDLFGPEAYRGEVRIDLWEPYLEAADS